MKRKLKVRKQQLSYVFLSPSPSPSINFNSSTIFFLALEHATTSWTYIDELSEYNLSKVISNTNMGGRVSLCICYLKITYEV